MKVGIISMQRILNYGSFLQAYALKSVIEQMGHEVGFIDIETAKTNRSTSSVFDKVLKKAKKLKYIDKYLLKRVCYSRKNTELNQMFIDEQKKKLGVDRYTADASGYDVVVIGSDEIFNCDSNSVWGITPQRFGGIVGPSCVLSYAASCGYTDINDLPDYDTDIVKKALGNMDMISVRDDNTYNFVYQLSGMKSEINLDPVLIYPFEQEISQGMEEGVPDYPYMLIYAYHNRIHAKNEIRAIKTFAQKYHLKTIAVGGSLPWCDEFAVITPFQVLAYFKKAVCIVTDTFHGTVMAAKFNKSLAVLVRDSNANKLNDLLRRIAIENHCVHDMDTLESILTMEDDYRKCNEIVESEKKKAYAYLCSRL